MVILLVDADSEARSHKASLLRAQQHEVIEAASAVEAVHWAQTSPRIDLLISEVILDPEHFGFDLTEAILMKHEQLRTLYTTRFDLTGYEDELAGHVPVPATASDDTFLAGVNTAISGPNQEPPKPVDPESLPPIMPAGAMLGQYQIIDRLYAELEAETYRAMQYTVQRPVALVLMKPHLLNDAAAVAQFKERERVKASITHPRVAPLYEAGEANGWLFYTREMPPGRALSDIAMAGENLSERVLVDVLYRVSEAMSFAVERHYNYRTLAPRDIFVDGEHQASIVNIFRPPAAMPRDEQADVRALLEMLAPFASQGKARGLLHELSDQSYDWAKLCARLHDIRTELSARSLIHRAADEDIAVRRPIKKRWLALAAGVVGLGVVAWLGALSGERVTSQTVAKLIADELVAVPAGGFIYQKGKHEKTDAFWISKYEVTIAQYAEFLDALKGAPNGKYDDRTGQPAKKTDHLPDDWAAYYTAARTGGMFNNHPVSLNSPVCGVDYWDAVAYANWKGRRLPTELEWEKAARGLSGNQFPWGNEPNPKAANLADDYEPTGKGGQIDGYNYWSPVDKPEGDVSPFGVFGMAGNVQEWTATWAPHPELVDKRVPVVRGGCYFATKSNEQVLTDRTFADDADESALVRGFRTVSDKPPAAKK
jgi:formylglycine-generating enzyme required for sulfatase activity